MQEHRWAFDCVIMQEPSQFTRELQLMERSQRRHLVGYLTKNVTLRNILLS